LAVRFTYKLQQTLCKSMVLDWFQNSMTFLWFQSLILLTHQSSNNSISTSSYVSFLTQELQQYVCSTCTKPFSKYHWICSGYNFKQFWHASPKYGGNYVKITIREQYGKCGMGQNWQTKNMHSNKMKASITKYTIMLNIQEH